MTLFCSLTLACQEAICDRKFSTYTDVWAYGVLLYEMFTQGTKPYENLDNIQVQMEVVRGYRLPQPADCPDSLYRLMLMCWDQEPRRRPEFPQIMECLTQFKAARFLMDPRGAGDGLAAGDSLRSRAPHERRSYVSELGAQDAPQAQGDESVSAHELSIIAGVCMCMYVCMYACLFVYVFGTCATMYIYIYIYMCVCVCLDMH